MSRSIVKAMLQGIHEQGWDIVDIVGFGGSFTGAAKPIEAVLERRLLKAQKADETLLRQCLAELEAIDKAVPFPVGGRLISKLRTRFGSAK